MPHAFFPIPSAIAHTPLPIAPPKEGRKEGRRSPLKKTRPHPPHAPPLLPIAYCLLPIAHCPPLNTPAAANAPAFTALDWSVVAIYLLAMALVGAWFSRRQKSTDDFFLASRSIPVWAAAVSIVATSVSAATFLGAPESAFRGNITYLSFNIASLISVAVVALFFIPAFYRNNVTTVYGLLTGRFGPGAAPFGKPILADLPEFVTRNLVDLAEDSAQERVASASRVDYGCRNGINMNRDGRRTQKGPAFAPRFDDQRQVGEGAHVRVPVFLCTFTVVLKNVGLSR